jgi:hypothetical protein
MAVYSTAKVKFSVGTTKATSVIGDYTSDTFTAIGEIEDLGELGDTSEIITFAAVTDARMRKAKGVADAGEFEITVGRDPADAGQMALRAALASSAGYNFKLELTDKPLAGASPKNTTLYFKALVNGTKNVMGGANDITKQTFTLAIQSEILEVAASAT